MKLSEQVQKALTYIKNIDVPETLHPWEAGRVFYEKFIPLAGEKMTVFQISEKEIFNDGNRIKLRIYRPNENDQSPVIIYFHGGWFNSGNLETHDTPLRQLANLSNTMIIAVDYRLAPEHPFPEGLEDCEFAAKWVIDNSLLLNIDSNKIMIAGDSAGGALAATITRKFRKEINAQILIYPVTDNSLQTDSWKEFQEGPLLDIKGAITAWNWYLPNMEDKKNSDAVPLIADDLDNLPPTFLAVAEYDPLKDEGILYADKLKTKNNIVHLKIYKGTTHGFFQMGGYIEDTNVLIGDIAGFIKTQYSL